jgi:hypothetical protein
MRARACYASAPMPIKLISLDLQTNVATVECWCGGRALIPLTGVTKDTPWRERCPKCRSVFDYPTDLQK